MQEGVQPQAALPPAYMTPRATCGEQLDTYELHLALLFVNGRPQTRNRHLPTRKKLRNGECVTIVQHCFLRNNRAALSIFTQPTRAVNRDSMGIRINENTNLHTLA